jgi:hypothetical protein
MAHKALTRNQPGAITDRAVPSLNVWLKRDNAIAILWIPGLSLGHYTTPSPQGKIKGNWMEQRRVCQTWQMW